MQPDNSHHDSPSIPLERALTRALSLAERAPREGWQHARAAYQEALLIDRPLFRAQAMLTLGRTLVLCEQFQEARRTIDQAYEMFSHLECAAGLATCRWQQGVILRFQSHLNEAATLLTRAAAELAQLGLEDDAAQAKRDLAITYNLMEHFDEGRLLIEDVRAFFVQRSQPVEVARCDLVIGARLRQLSRPQEALSVLQKALSVFRSNDRPVDAGKTLQMLALIYLQLQAYDGALYCLDEEEKIFISADLPLRLAYCVQTRGRALWHLGKLDEARSCLIRAQNWFERQDMPRDVADCLLNLGNLAFTEGDLIHAESLYHQALRYYGELDLEVYEARCRQNLALTFRYQGEWSAALNHLHRAADTFEQYGVPVWAADCHTKMVGLYALLRQKEQALHHLERARRIYDQEKIVLSTAWCNVLQAQIGEQGMSPDDILSSLQLTCQIIEKTGVMWHTGLCHRLMGDLLLDKDRPSEALRQYEAAQTYFSRVDAVVDKAISLAGMGRAYARLGELDLAEESLLSSLYITGDALPEWSWSAYAALGDVVRARDDSSSALYRYRQAVEALGTLRRTVPEEELAGGLVTSRHFVYETGVELALEHSDSQQALAMIEEGKTRVLEQLLRSVSIDAEGDPYLTRLQERETHLRAAITSLRHQVAFSFEHPSIPSATPAENPKELLGTLRTKRTEYRQVLRQLRAASGSLNESTEPFTWERFRACADATLDVNWSVLAYYWLDRDLVIIHGDAQGLHTHVRSLSRLDRAALEMCTAPAPERRTLAFQNQLYGDTVPSPVSRNYRRRLYDLLIPPEATLDPDRCLAIIPHGRLHYLPFHALENDAGFLVQQAIPFYAPSLRTLQAILERAGHYVAPVVKVLLISVNTFPQGRSPLQWTSSETSRLSELYDERAILLDNAEATIDTLREWSEQKTLCRFSLLHFATHADLDVASGALSGIALQDADLTAEEVSRLRLGPATVVLSACQSGLGEIQAGDELFGLPYAFFVAGAQSVVASLWHVDDECTADLMFTLHRLLDQGEPSAHALAHTQRLAIRQGLSPYAWAAFAAMGVP